MCREILDNLLSGTKAGFKATRNLVFNQKAEGNTMNRQKSRGIVENVLSGTKAGLKAILNFEHAIERKKMDHQKSKSTFNAILLSLILMVTAFWVSPAAAQKYVTDPTTGKVVTAPEYGGTLTFLKAEEAEHMDIALQLWAGGYVGGVVEKLGMGDWAIKRGEWNFQFLNPPAATRGALAESWSQPDALTYIIKVRQGVHWHDKAPMNGRELTADDIAYNFRRVIGWGGGFTEPSVFSTVLKIIKFESIIATDKFTVVFKLKEPNLTMLKGLIDDNVAYIYPPDVIEEHGDARDWRNLVGTGAFELTDWTKGSSLTYEKNPDYWGFDEKYPENRLPYVDEIKALVMPETATQLAALRSGKADYMGVIGRAQIRNIDQVESLQRTNPELVIWPYVVRSDQGFGMNVQRKPFDDIRVRKAMQMALDLEAITQGYFKGWADPVPQGHISRDMKDVVTQFEDWPEDVKKVFTYDPEGAKKLLAEAGYPNGFKTTMVHLEPWDANYSELIASLWAEIGVEVDVQVTPLATFVSKRQARDFDMITAVAAFKQIPYSPPMIYTTQASWNSSNVSLPEYDAKWKAATEATTIEEMNRLSNELNMWAIEEFWQIWTPMAQSFVAVQPWLTGFNGESKLVDYADLHVFARLWIDSALKKEMGH